MANGNYAEKLNTLKEGKLYLALPASTRDLISTLGHRYRLTNQEFRVLTGIARDLEMWRERPLEKQWERYETGS